jgi:hypothetical protein
MNPRTMLAVTAAVTSPGFRTSGVDAGSDGLDDTGGVHARGERRLEGRLARTVPPAPTATNPPRSTERSAQAADQCGQLNSAARI